MQQLNATKKTAFSTSSIVRKCFTVLALGLLFTACSKDNDDDGNTPNPPGGNPPPATEESYYALKTSMKLSYKTTDADGPQNHTLTVLNQKDSAGGKVVSYATNYSDGTSFNSSVFIKGSTATFISALPSDLSAVVEELKADPAVSNLVLTGIPIQQKLPVKPQVGQAIEFSDPMHLGWTVTEDNEDFRVDMYVALTEGKVISFEDVTTEAGTFKSCMKWQYKSTFTMEAPSGVEEKETQNTVWFAKGIGLVKSTETVDGTTNTTMITSVTGK